MGIDPIPNIKDEAYDELCQENERLKARILSPQERGYLLGLLKGHLEYYRWLGGNPKCSASNHESREFIEKLVLKLSL
jgi:hypothetical protein